MLTFIVLGMVPGTQIQLTFNDLLLAVLVVISMGLIIKLIRIAFKNRHKLSTDFNTISI